MRRALSNSWIVAGVVAVGVLAAAGALQARNYPAAGRVVAVDVARVFQEYQRQKDLLEEMNTKQEQLQKENQARREAIDALQATTDRMNPNDPLYTSKVRELLQMQIEYKNWFDLTQADMAREVGVWTAKIYEEIVASVSDMANKEGIDLVLYKEDFRPGSYAVDNVRQAIVNRKVLFAGPAADPSQALIDKLNAAYRAMPKSNMLQIGAPTPPPAGPGAKKP